ncbi:MAG: DUF1800 family protein [Acidimicrobiales bacterium]
MRTSGRSGRTAAAHRRRINLVDQPVPVGASSGPSLPPRPILPVLPALSAVGAIDLTDTAVPTDVVDGEVVADDVSAADTAASRVTDASGPRDATMDRRRLIALLATGSAGAVTALAACTSGTSSTLTAPAPVAPGPSPTPPGAPRHTPTPIADPGTGGVDRWSDPPTPRRVPGTEQTPGGGSGTGSRSSGGGRGPGRNGAPRNDTPPATDPGPGTGPGTSPGTDPGTNPGTGPGQTPGPGPGPAPVDPMLEIHRQARLIERITFGATPALVDQVATLGANGFLEQQLTMAPAGVDGVLTGAPHLLDVSPGVRWANREGRNLARDLRHATVVRAVHHPGQLAEMMVAFWNNHLSTYSGEDDKNVGFAAATDDTFVIRRHAMGKVSDLILASARSVSMQLYLDNFRSTATNPNQNYARELMELHTMGEGNGYDEDDVAAVSFILSGWGLRGRIQDGDDTFGFEYQPNRHNSEPRSVDITLPNGQVAVWSTPGRSGPAGEQDGIDFINWLTRLPNTARYISWKLARRFVSEDPSPAMVQRMAAAYLANDTAIVPVLRVMLTSPEFDESRRTKIKTPLELLVGMLRATGADIDRTVNSGAAQRIQEQLSGQGHLIFGWPTPDGFPDERAFWITTNSLMRRWEMAGRLGNNRLGGLGVDTTALLPSPMPATVGELIVALAQRLGTGIDETAVSGLATYIEATHDAPVSAVRLDRHLGNLVGMLLSAPAYQFR